MKNIFYFSHINIIGGIEQFFAYLAEKYCDWDITIIYRSGDPKQIARLRKYVRVEHFSGHQIDCDKAFFCFNCDILPYVNAKETTLVLHGDYKAMVEQKQLDADCYIFSTEFDNYYGVSKQESESWKEITGKDCTLVYNPFVKYPTKHILKLVYCGRLTTEKGGELTQKLIKRLRERGIDYQLYVYSDRQSIQGDNIIYLGTRLDAGQFLSKDNYDYIIVPSKNEGYCYSLVQALSNGLPAVVTPCPVFKEIGVTDSNSITLEFDGSNVDEVIDKMLTSDLQFTYTAKDDNWSKVLSPGKSTYEPHIVEVQAVQRYFDICEQVTVEMGDTYFADRHRADELISKGFAKEINNGKSRKR